jgi:hypothetical protein
MFCIASLINCLYTAKIKRDAMNYASFIRNSFSSLCCFRMHTVHGTAESLVCPNVRSHVSALKLLKPCDATGYHMHELEEVRKLCTCQLQQNVFYLYSEMNAVDFSEKRKIFCCNMTLL